MVERSLPARGGRGAYAEHYGRCIHFLVTCARVFDREDCRSLAHRAADEALEVLSAQDMFRTHPGEDRYDAVDGLGYLFMALMDLATGEDGDLMGSGW